jgi:hypothetical protein
MALASRKGLKAIKTGIGTVFERETENRSCSLSTTFGSCTVKRAALCVKTKPHMGTGSLRVIVTRRRAGMKRAESMKTHEMPLRINLKECSTIIGA